MPVARIDRGGPGRAHAAAEDVGADDEEAVGVDRLARARSCVSHQPGLPVTGCVAGDVLVAGQRVADQDGVGLGGVERAVGLVGDLEGAELLAAVEPQRLLGGKRTTGLDGLSTSAERDSGCAAPSPARRRMLPIAGCRSSMRASGSRPGGAANRKPGPAAPPSLPGRAGDRVARAACLASCLTWLQAGRPNHHDRAGIGSGPGRRVKTSVGSWPGAVVAFAFAAVEPITGACPLPASADAAACEIQPCESDA